MKTYKVVRGSKEDYVNFFELKETLNILMNTWTFWNP